MNLQKEITSLESYKTLWNYQREAIDYLLKENKCCGYMPIGSGKTRVSLLWSELITDNKDITIVIAPSKQLEQWEKEINKLLEYKRKPYVIDEKLETFIKRINKKNLWSKDNIYITTYARFNDDLLQLLEFTDSDINDIKVILDESQFLRNIKDRKRQKKGSKRAWNAKLLVDKLKNVILLSGTPIANNIEGMYSQMVLVDTKNRPQTREEFQQEFCYMERVYTPYGMVWKPNPKKHKHGAVEKIWELMAYQTFLMKPDDERLKSQLPESVFIDVTIKESKEYKEFIKENAISDFKANTTMAKLSAYRQLASGFLYKSKKNVILNGDGFQESTSYDTTRFNTDKIERLEELILSTNKNLIIYYNYDEERKMIIELLDKLDIRHSSINAKGRDESCFRDIDIRGILLVQYITGSVGLDGLQKHSDTIVYYSPILDSSLYQQSIGRINRIGSNFKTTYFYRFMTKNSVEEHIVKDIMDNAKQLSDRLFNSWEKRMSGDMQQVENEKGEEMLTQEEKDDLESGNNSNKKDDSYKEHPFYEELKNLSVKELEEVAEEMEVVGFDKSENKANIIKQIVEFVMLDEEVDKKEDNFKDDLEVMHTVKTEETIEEEFIPMRMIEMSDDLVASVTYMVSNTGVDSDDLFLFEVRNWNKDKLENITLNGSEITRADLLEIDSMFEKVDWTTKVEDELNDLFKPTKSKEPQGEYDSEEIKHKLFDPNLKANKKIKSHSYSSLQRLIKNPADYKYYYVEGLKPLIKEEKDHFLLGSAAHAMIEADGDINLAREIANESNPEYDYEDRETVINKGLILGNGALKALKFNKKILAEPEFVVQIDEKNKFGGFIDNIYETKNGDIGIGEWKTSGQPSKLINAMNFITQAHVYAMVFFKATGIKPVEFNYKIMVKPTISQTKKETVEEYLQRYAEKVMEKNDYNEYANFKDLTIKLEWNKVEKIWKDSVLTPLELLKVYKKLDSWPINEDHAVGFGKWDYDVFYDSKVENPEQYFAKKPKDAYIEPTGDE